ncbi:putative ascorbate-specific transmembrane electron transporter 1 [Acorus gramineus]|uniref:Ascorbate-specific transmembrane electron transporter 1 n=1 Tax=Acorus gramineus TaxID=55184 RepID=A0AAV9AGX5_ACOGR|nr:putative ascorbate-specific transmembrane electron transporter 1 [Acorus gramineus]
MAVIDGGKFRISTMPVTIVAHLLGLLVLILTLIWLLHFEGGVSMTKSTKLLFNLHPLLMVIGFVLVGGEAIMAYKTVPAPRKVQKIVHMAMLLVASLMGAFGVFVIFKYKRESKYSDMESIHSWIGMATVCLFGLQWLLGFVSFWFPGAPMTTRARLMPWHVFFGIIIFVMAIISTETGIMEEFCFGELSRERKAYLINFTGVAVLLFGVTVGLTAILP